MSEYIVEFGDRPINEDNEYIHEPIVRCRDCAYICHREYNSGPEYQTCSYFDSRYAEVEPDGFCAWGVRKVDA